MRRYEFPSRIWLPALMLPPVPSDECARLLDCCTKFVEPHLARTALERGYRLTVCDIEPETPAVERVDITNPLPWPEHYFRGVISADTLEHVVPKREILAEFFRITEPKGFLMLHLPVGKYGDSWQRHTTPDVPDNQHNHVWVPGTDYADIAQSVGYSLVAEVSGWDQEAICLSKLWVFRKDPNLPWDK